MYTTAPIINIKGGTYRYLIAFVWEVCVYAFVFVCLCVCLCACPQGINNVNIIHGLLQTLLSLQCHVFHLVIIGSKVKIEYYVYA